jgi:hypothetical protein
MFIRKLTLQLGAALVSTAAPRISAPHRIS